METVTKNNPHVTHVDSTDKLTCITCQYSRDEYKNYNKQLEAWGVRYRGYILKHYPRNLVTQAILTTKKDEKFLRNPGAYFRTVLLELVAEHQKGNKNSFTSQQSSSKEIKSASFEKKTKEQLYEC